MIILYFFIFNISADVEKTKITSQLSSFKEKSFSEYLSVDVVKKLEKNRVVYYGDIIPGKIELGDEYVDNIILLWKNFPTSISPSGFGMNEAEKKALILFLLSPIPVWDKFDYRMEFAFKNALVTGILDFAVTPRGWPTPVVLLIQAKDYNVEQGFAQTYLQLQSCYELGKEEIRVDDQQNMNTPFYVYGIVTTVSAWYFIRYDGAKWVHSKPVVVEDRQHRDGIKKVISNIYNILIYQSKYLGI